MIFNKKIKNQILPVGDIAMPSVATYFTNENRFSLLYTGCINDATVRDSGGTEHTYQRSRADFTV